TNLAHLGPVERSFCVPGAAASAAAPARSALTRWPLLGETQMALPANRSLRQLQVDCFSPSVGASPVAAVARSPSRGTIVKVGGVLVSGLSTSDCSVA